MSSVAKKTETNQYCIAPSYQNKFRPAAAKDIIHSVLSKRLAGQFYNAESVSQWTREISDEIKSRLKEMELDRYKWVVQVVIGEQRGEGVRMACRCFWDANSDNYAQDIFMNESIFCIAAAFGVYLY
mmetsp:Transcript_17001/g.28071  ORF Transcript_17001/g.28071 Transcript_17001/m.28071 type:complete len:127 (+) Transcript_17001:131-511(+)|eukprot:CAMPEP_0184656090 /NCGR_PEP_ID=MMETSP0308-20130426/15548_1 /TAXON_ID=38269 /ORGANISM="Gloeochaete witrockiana, Strain SAG 46.84" /LENGTH=126 /DNA_ID=CAMNT_0027093017 /DNA_START=113 /DNA_END=493 /DNA_ORIENTATION=-